MNKAFRPTARPLMVCDPYFSVWSFSDNLYDDSTRHWTGARQSMCGALLIDGHPYRFLGLNKILDHYRGGSDCLKQTSVTVNPTTTIYTFSHKACDLKVSFVTPLLMDRLEVMTRPVSYVFYEITPKEEGHSFEFYIDASCEIAGDPVGQDYKVGFDKGHVWVGNNDQNVLGVDGDDVRIDWGYLHMIHDNATVAVGRRRTDMFSGRGLLARKLAMDPREPIPFKQQPILFTTSDKLSDKIIFAYDDIKAIKYYDRHIDAYYKKFYGTFEAMLEVAIREADTLRAECEAFDAKMMAEMEAITPEYALIGALSYRQSIAAHKVVEIDGKLMFLSKENFSNGCLATLDVTYPSIPLFLLYNPELVRGMMRPLFDFARTEQWKYEFAPHDCGRYPYLDGQRYGLKDGELLFEKQMPVEECGNAILTMAAQIAADGDRTLLEENADLLKQWADYLVKYGYNPENQLCTDDFAGHLAHNCNLSLKAIVALGAYAKLFDAPEYGVIAKDMANRWVKDAKKKRSEGWRLTFDKDATWSLKYNIIWDRLLDLGLFDQAVNDEEIRVYIKRMNRYGTPLDSRAAYTKLDWLAWTTVMADNKEYTDRVYKSIARMICESQDRVPLTDWYLTDSGKHVGFQARSVLGGFYINLLAKKLLNK